MNDQDQSIPGATMPIIEAPNSVPLGQPVTLTLRNSSSRQDCYILQNSIMLPDAITLEPDQPFDYFPEAPGHYVVKGAGCEASVDVLDPADIRSGPVLEGQSWFPSAWTAAVDNGYESAVMSLLPHLVESGAVVYDLGANIGMYAKQFLSLANEAGYVYCFEPNPLAIHYLSINLARTGADNYLILPLAVSDGFGTTELVVNPDNLALGSSYFQKRGIRINVRSAALDDVIESYGLRPPDVIKMDIEGGEVVAIRGMLQTIEKYNPVLIFELHGRHAATETLRHLEAYDWQIAGDDRHYTARQLTDAFPEACLQVIGVTPR